MQQQIAEAQAELAEAEVTGTAGGGLVTVTVTGLGRGQVGVKIDPKAVDPDDVETLEDLVLAAMHNAAEAAAGADRGEDGPGHRRPRRPRPARVLTRVYEGAIQDLIDELGRLPGVGPEERPADRLPRPVGRPGRRQPAGQRAAQGQGAGPVLHDLLQRGRVGAVPDLPRPAPHRRGALRGRGAQGRRGDRADRRVPRPLPRARRGDQPARGHRPGQPADPRADGPARHRRGQGADPGHRPEHRGRGHRDLPGADGQADGASRSPGWPAACRSAATWSTPTRSPSAGPSRAAARSENPCARVGGPALDSPRSTATCRWPAPWAGCRPAVSVGGAAVGQLFQCSATRSAACFSHWA